MELSFLLTGFNWWPFLSTKDEHKKYPQKLKIVKILIK
jgi:hypothetical protein